MATEYIAHVTPGSANKNLAVSGIMLPTDSMYIYTDYLGEWELDGARVTSIPNQHVNPSIPVSSLGMVGYDGQNPYLVKPLWGYYDQPNAERPVRALKFARRWVGSPWFYSSRGSLRASVNVNVPGLSGVTAAILMKGDLSISSYDGSYRPPHIPMSITLDPSGNTMIELRSPSSINANWQLRYGVYDFIDINPADIGSIEQLWTVIAITYDLPTKEVRIYINGVFKKSVTIPGSVITATVISQNNYGNARSNPLDYCFSGYIAHTAAWARTLSNTDVLNHYKYIKNKYGLL